MTFLSVAAMISAGVFVCDCATDFDFAISVLYTGALLVASVAGSAQDLRRSALICTALVIAGWIIVHGDAPTIASILHATLAGIAVNITASLLVSRKKLEAARLEADRSRAELESFSDSVPQLLWRINAAGSVEYFNHRYTELTGRDRFEAIAQQNWAESFHPEDVGLLSERFAAALAAGGDLTVVFRMLHADGQYRWMSLKGRPVRSLDTGEVIAFYGGTSDVHEEVLAQQERDRLRAELEHSRAELQIFTDSVPQILWRANVDGPIEYFNRRYTDVTGQQVSAAIYNEGWREVVHPEDQELATSLLAESRDGPGALRTKFRMRHIDGEYRWMSLYGVPVFGSDGEIIARYGGTLDIHDEVIANEKITLLNDTLERRVAERTAELRLTEARYSSLFEISNITFAEMDFSQATPYLARLRAEGVVDLRAHLASHPQCLADLLGLIETLRLNEAMARLVAEVVRVFWTGC